MKTAGFDRRLKTWLKNGGVEGVCLFELPRGASESCWRVGDNGRTFFVYLDMTGAGRHHCTCSDWYLEWVGWRRWAKGMLCRHIAAAALRGGLGELLLGYFVESGVRG